MADAGGEGGGGEGGEWLPIFERVEAQIEALAADRARREAADRVQRESWEAARRLQRSVEELQAAAREKDAEIDRLRGEAADARKKLQADAGRKLRWEAAYVELILGANQKLAELRDSDFEDSRTLAENPGFKEVESCTELNQNTTDHTTSDLRAELRKLKQAYEALSSKKDKELSALLSEKDSVRNQLSILQQDYAKLLKNKKLEAEQATGAAQKLRRNIDELKVLAQEKDHEISMLRGEAVGAKKNLQRMHSLVKEKDGEILTLKGQHPESVQKHNKDISETHKRSRSGDRAVTVRDKPENSGIRQTVGEDCISETRTVENDGKDVTTHKRRRASSMSNDKEKSGSDEDDDEQIGNKKDADKHSESDEDGNKQSGSDADGDKQTGSDEDGGEQSGSGEDGDGDDNDEQSGSDDETTHNQVREPLRNPRGRRYAYNNEDKGDVRTWLRYWNAPAPLRSKKREISNGRFSYSGTGNWGQYVKDVNDSLVDKPDKQKKFVQFLRNFENRSARDAAGTMKVLLNGQPKLIRRLNRFLPNKCQIELPGCRGQVRGRGHPRRRFLPRQPRDQSQIRETATQGGGALVIDEPSLLIRNKSSDYHCRFL